MFIRKIIIAIASVFSYFARVSCFLLVGLASLAACGEKSSDVSFDAGNNVSEIKSNVEGNVIRIENHLLFSWRGMNAVAKCDDSDSIVTIDYYDAVEFDTSVLTQLKSGVNLGDVVQNLGLPSYIGISDTPSLDYSNDVITMYRLFFEKSNGKLTYSSVSALDKRDSHSWIDENKTDFPDEEEIDKLKMGMSIDEVVAILGKPQSDIGSGVWLFVFKLSSGKQLVAGFGLEFENAGASESSDEDYSYLCLNALELKG